MAKADPELNGSKLGKSCVLSTASSDRPGYGQDELFDGSRSAYYSLFLGKLKNPLKANLCASAMDKWNLGQMTGSTTRSVAPKSVVPPTNPLSREDVKKAFGDIASKTGDASFNQLADACSKILTDYSKFDPSRLSNEKLTDEQRKAALQCVLQKRNELKIDQVPGVSAVIQSAIDPEKSPGVASVIEFAKLDVNQLKGCSQDWSAYAKAAVEVRAPAKAKAAGRPAAPASGAAKSER